MNTQASVLRKSLASAIAAALIVTAPGLPCWQAVAQTVTAPAVPVGASAVGVAGSAAGALGTGSQASLSLPGASLGTLPVFGLGLTVPQSNGALPPDSLAPRGEARGVAISPLSPAASPEARSAAPTSGLLADPSGVTAAPEQIAAMPASQAREAGASMMDPILRTRSRGALPVEVPASSSLEGPATLAPSSMAATPEGESSRGAMPSLSPSQGPAPSRFSAGGLLKSVVLMGAGAGAVIGLQAAALAFLPGLFGFLPIAAVWAVASGAVVFPIALYQRYRLSLRDSARLKGPKLALDLLLGAFIGAAAVAAPALLSGAFLAGLASAPGAMAAAGLIGAAGTVSAFTSGSVGNNRGLELIGMYGAMAIPSLVLGAAGGAALTLGGVLGLMAVPALMTVSFFLGRIINAAETGQPFSVPGLMQAIRFPSYTWVMTGVVFALLTGFTPYMVNYAFMAWMFFGNGKLFDYALLAALGLAAFSGFTAPVTFLVLAFLPERAAIWTERLLGRLLPKSLAAPSSAAPLDYAPEEDKPVKWPRLHFWLKTIVLLGTLAGLGVTLAVTVFGVTSLITNTLIAAALSALPFIFGTKLIKAMTKAEPVTEGQAPELYKAMKTLQARINAGRAAKGQKPVPLPEIVRISSKVMPVPNAFATGRSPFSALVGVTEIFEEMVLNPESLRAGLLRMLATADAASPQYKVFRLAILGSIPGIKGDASPADLMQAVRSADRVQLKALGERVLLGVLGHEYSHVMNRDILIGTIAGTLSSGIAFASYGVLWAVGNARARFQRLLGRPGSENPGEPSARRPDGSSSGDVKPEVVEPVSTIAGIKVVIGLIKVFAALWAPVIAQVIQMSIGRQREGAADEDGSIYSEDPESLALGLGLLMSWRPPAGLLIQRFRMPLWAATAGLFTLNSLRQMDDAGMLTGAERPKARGATRKDDWLFQLFITHPNTNWRIEKLYERAMSRHGKDRAGPGAGPVARLGPGGGPLLAAALPVLDDHPPPLAPLPGAGPPGGRSGAAERGGLLQRAWDGVKRPFRVLPDEGRNREFWKFVFGQALLNLGIAFHYTALPNLVAPTKELSARLGYNRALNWGSQAVASLTTGPLVDRSSVQKVLVWTYLGRALLLLSVPLFFFNAASLTALWPVLTFFVLFQVVVFVTGFLQNTGMTAQAVAFNRIIAQDRDHYNRANAVYGIVVNVVGVIGPLMAGTFIGAMDLTFGVLSGNALAYGVYGILALIVALQYGFWLRLPRDGTLKARRELGKHLKRTLHDPRIKGISDGTADGKPALLVEVKGPIKEVQPLLPAEFMGYPVVAASRRRPVAELLEGLHLVWRDRFLRLTMLFTTFEVMAGDPIVFTALPRFIKDVLGSAQAVLPSILHLPFVGGLLEALTSQAGAFGLYLAVASLGLGMSTMGMMLLKHPAGSELERRLSEFRQSLEARDPPLGEARLVAAVEGARGGVQKALDRFRDVFKKDPAAELPLDALQAELSARLAEGINEKAFEGRAPPEEIAALLEETGLGPGLQAWAQRHMKALERQARRDARTGLDRMERQGKWTSILYGLGALVYWGVFFSSGLWPSLAAMLLVTFLQGPGNVVWASLNQRVVLSRYRRDMGKIYAAMAFYMLVFSIVGVLGFGWLMATVPTQTALWIVGIVMTMVAFLHIIEPYIVFPVDRGWKK